MVGESLDLSAVRKRIADCIARGCIDREVIHTLGFPDHVVPKECELWDYKHSTSDDSVSVATTVLQVVSLYNSYGGYLIFGVAELERDQRFEWRGITDRIYDVAKLRTTIRNYTGDHIDVTYRLLEMTDSVKIGLLHVPQRPSDQLPTTFGKDGPTKPDGRPVFVQGHVYFRRGDENVRSSGRGDLQFLLSRRTLASPGDANRLFASDEIGGTLIPSNLPDRSAVCSRFIGRDSYVEELWNWLGDPLSYVRVLAGEGGLGKTSIAYEFAEEVVRKRPSGIGQVIWLTAKRKQFVGLSNEYVDVNAPRFFHDLDSLLKAICGELAVLDSEIAGASRALLRRLATDSLTHLRGLLVIDDVDSIEDLDEQRLVLETIFQAASTSKSRALLTTRMNLAVAADSCIRVEGFSEQDFREYCKYLVEKYKLAPLSSKGVTQLFRTGGGSPLFTESIIRLVRTGSSIGEAVNEWRGKEGELVRRAALGREIRKLSLESRRVLLACTLLIEASQSELQQATSYGKDRIAACLAELQSLFMVSSPRLIKSEPRFRVADVTMLLVKEMKDSLVPDPRKVEAIVKDLRQDKAKYTGHEGAAGKAISQALALLRTGRTAEAIQSVRAGLQQVPEHPDLTAMLGQCYLLQAQGAPTGAALSEARNCFRKAYTLGAKRESLFEHWYQAESEASDHTAAVEVATLAMEKGSGSVDLWLSRRADANYRIANTLIEARQIESSDRALKACLEDLQQIAEHSGDRIDTNNKIAKTVDLRWRLLSAENSLSGIRVTQEAVAYAVRIGDVREVNYVRMVDSADAAMRRVSVQERSSGRSHNLVRMLVRETSQLIHASPLSAEVRSKLLARCDSIESQLA